GVRWLPVVCSPPALRRCRPSPVCGGRCRSLFSATASPGTSALSLHDALPILTEGLSPEELRQVLYGLAGQFKTLDVTSLLTLESDRKSTRLNSSHQIISYAVFCLKKKKTACSGACHSSLRHRRAQARHARARR